MLEQLRSTPPGGFDAAYMTMQAQAHEEAIALFSGYASNGDDPALRNFAARTLPTLENHARMVERITGEAHAGM
jgi:putative membrane protein